MGAKNAGAAEGTYPVRVAASVTGLTPELLRAWETRYDAVQPGRTAGGSRRYSDADLARLKLLHDVVDAGHRIGNVAHLDAVELKKLLPKPADSAADAIEEIIADLERLDGHDAQRRLSQALLALGPVAFARTIALPLLSRIGERWARGDLSIVVEHLAAGILRSLLISAIAPAADAHVSRRIVFATPGGEPHDLGTLVASLVAMKAGADVLFVGADVPVDDLTGSVIDARAAVLALGVVTLPKTSAERVLREIRSRLPERIGCWIGGAGIVGLAPLAGIERISNLDQLEAHVRQLIPGGTSRQSLVPRDESGQGGSDQGK